MTGGKDMKCMARFHCNNFCATSSQCFVVCTFPILFYC